jgi:hypothetical protein
MLMHVYREQQKATSAIVHVHAEVSHIQTYGPTSGDERKYNVMGQTEKEITKANRTNKQGTKYLQSRRAGDRLDGHC